MISYTGVFGGHIVIQFLLYGHAPALPHFMNNEIVVFLFPFIVALFGYFFAFSRSPILKSQLKWRVPIFRGLSFISALLSLNAGLFWAFNTYGT